jgi:hypothetical protein
MLDDALAPLRAALRSQRVHSTDVCDPLAVAAAAFAVDARNAGIRVEDVVIHVKKEIESAVNGGMVEVTLHEPVRHLLVTSAIKAYYLQ